jgi:hypothetical protein
MEDRYMGPLAIAPSLIDLLDEILQKTTTLIVFRAREHTVTGFFRRERQTRTATRPSLMGALLALLGREPLKFCAACNQHKPQPQFSTDRSRGDKLTPICRVCHKARRRKVA